MSRSLSERELKRVGRVLAGHSRDKDRQRWKRKLAGQAKPFGSEKPLRTLRDDLVDESHVEIEGPEE